MGLKRIYISGAITNTNDYETRFQEAEQKLKNRGFAVFNPVKNIGFEYKDYIDMGLAELSHCDTIFMLDGWDKSKGAKLELQYADIVGIEIIFEIRKGETNGTGNF